MSIDHLGAAASGEKRRVLGERPLRTAAVLMELYGLDDRSGNVWQYIGGYNKGPLRAVMR